MTPSPRRSIPLLALLLLPGGALPGLLAQDEKGGGARLSADASLGAVLDREGSASIRRVNAERWTLAAERTRLEQGDWLKTATRGANALALRLGKGELLLGPKTLIEIKSGDTVRVYRGELELKPAKGGRYKIQGPGGAALTITSRAVVRARQAERKLEQLQSDPRWLTGYRGHASSEAMGSLLAKVDGRNVPLTMGYHKVTVDIRDQIARTTVEESFINRTNHVLEGVFYFPLPADASISGFGMWIGDELVHGEIVEKQRARAIYETILREKRDPGLLEWAGGNIFKARVYPISHEKRIRIVYTQVLPKEGNTYRYHYALQSEMLRTKPLKKLELKVLVDSSERLAKVHSPSHDCRVRTTSNNASLEFQAEEHTPQRDFELRIETKPRAGNITFIPHRRGEDGYFMCLVDAPPAADGGQPAKAKPLDIIVVADTSGSLAGTQRGAQVQFIEALLDSLGSKDTFNLLTSDTEARWAFSGTTEVKASNVEKALAFLEARHPLGWTDLDAAFASVMKRVGPNTHVVYVGDAAITTGQADPAAFARRLQRLHAAQGGKGTFHAVQPGSMGESLALRGIAALGGGSMRAIGGGSDPAAVAAELLVEITTPALRNLKVTFDGVQVAAVYPRRLPNLPVGTQQILVGRYDPRVTNQRGKIQVSGNLAGKPVRYGAPVTIAAKAGEGNSFIPRLWARQHLDHLLQQGRSAPIQKRIIALSEDFQIITPYTSFLVLESEADRIRFKVKKRFRMRDGEEFFAKGRDNALYALKRKQLLAAKKWRKQLRATLLANLSGLNRDLTRLLSRRYAGMVSLVAQGEALDKNQFGARLSGGKSAKKDGTLSFDAPRAATKGAPVGDDDDGAKEAAPVRKPMPAAPPMPDEEKPREAPEFEKKKMRAKRPYRSSRFRSRRQDRRGYYGYYRPNLGALAKSGFLPVDEKKSNRTRYSRDPFQRLFPRVSSAPAARKQAKWTWPAEVVKVLTALRRRQMIQTLAGGLKVTSGVESTDHRGRTFKMQPTVRLLAKDAWVVVSGHTPGETYTTSWVRKGRRGLLSATFRTGTTRKAEPTDATGYSWPFAWYHWGQSTMTVTLRRPGPERVELTFQNPNKNQRWGVRTRIVLIDTKRNVVLSVRAQRFPDGKETRTTYGGFTQVAGQWWPATATTITPEKTSTTTRYTVEHVQAAQLEATFDALLARARPPAVLLPLPLPTLDEAKQAIRDKQAKAVDHWVALRPLVRAQRWDEAQLHAKALQQAWTGRPVRTAFSGVWLGARRRNQELKQLLHKVAADLVKTPREAEATLARNLLSWSQSTLNRGNERKALLELLQPVYARRKQVADPLWGWEQQMLSALRAMRQVDVVLKRMEQNTKTYPFQYSAHTQWADRLARRGEVEKAVQHVDAVAKQHAPWRPWELRQFRTSALHILWNARRYEALVKRTDAWMKQRVQLDSSHYNRYLTALVMLDREKTAARQIETWMTAWSERPLDTITLAQLDAAIAHCIGQGYGWYYYSSTIEPERATLLARTARKLMQHAVRHDRASRIVGNYRFRRTDAGKVLAKELWSALEKGAATLPAPALYRQIGWVRSIGYRPRTGAQAWGAVWKTVYARWSKTQVGDEARRLLGSAIRSWAPREHKLARLRVLLGEATQPSAKRTLATQLVQMLRYGAWSEAAQQELFKLFPLLGPITDGEQAEQGKALETSRNAHVAHLHELMSWLVSGRSRVVFQARKDRTKLSRRQVRSARAEATRASRVGLAQLYGGLRTTWPQEYLRPWFSIEQMWLQVKLSKDREGTRAQTTKLLLDSLKGDSSSAARDLRLRILASRSVATLIYLLSEDKPAVRSKHLPGLAKLVAAALEKENKLLDWRQVKFTLLVALDQGDPLLAALQAWYGDGSKVSRTKWGRTLAHVLAERDRLKDAVGALTGIPAGELEVTDWTRLSDWYTCLNQRDKARQAKLKAWGLQSEWRLANALRSESYKYRRRGRGVPASLSPEIPVRFVALFRKARNPGNYMYVLRTYYGATRDFRLLECVPEAVIGQSSQKIYPVLTGFRQIANMLQEEATLDRLTKRLRALHARAKTKVDRRALRLLEFMVEHKASAQTHGAGPHAANALRALREAFRDGGWEKGEARLMASFLASQGRLRPDSLAQEQVRQVGALARLLEVGSADHLQVSQSLANLQWTYRRKDEALRVLSAAIDARREASGGRLPSSARSALSRYGSWLQQMGEYMKAEKVYLDELRQVNAYEGRWYTDQLYRLYRAALHRDAEVSLGRGTTLYKAVRDKLYKEIEVRSDEYRARQLVGTLCTLFYEMSRSKLRLRAQTPHRADLRELAFKRLPRVLAMYHYRDGQSMVGTVAGRLRDIVGYPTALEFLVTRAESEPRWLRLRGQDFWSRHGGTVAYYRYKARNSLSAALEGRLLSIVLRALTKDLDHGRSRSRGIYSRHYSRYFWSEMREAFAQAARNVLQKRAGSEQVLLRVARYFYRGLQQRPEAIELLLARHQKRLLGQGGRIQLVRYLQGTRRWAESIPLLKVLIEERPDVLDHRTKLMTAASRTRQPRLLLDTLQAAVAYLKENKRWHEYAIATLGRACMQARLFERAAPLMEAAIKMRTRSRSNRGVGDSTLARYYGDLAEAHSQLGNTIKAVDAAAGAIVSWGGSAYTRRWELQKLERVLRRARDIDGYVKHLDAEVKKTGLENPILRKALGKVYRQRGEFDKARAQLGLALGARSNDQETHRLLIQVYDALQRPTDAARQLLALARLKGHDGKIYRELGDRFQRAGFPKQAERAYTNMVEMQPNESASHQALAEVRQRQERWAQAAHHWRHVVRIRTDEPQGYIGLGKTLVRLEKLDEARKVLKQLETRTFQRRFKWTVQRAARDLRRRIEQAKPRGKDF